MELQYLDFDCSEDAEGALLFDAMASVLPQRLPALLDEVAAVLGWAQRAFAGARAPLDEGGEWDFLLEGAEEVRPPLAPHGDDAGAAYQATALPPGADRHTVHLSLVGTAAFGEALREAFAID